MSALKDLIQARGNAQRAESLLVHAKSLAAKAKTLPDQDAGRLIIEEEVSAMVQQAKQLNALARTAIGGGARG